MTRSPDAHEIQIEVDGHLVAAAEVSRTDDPEVVRSAMHVESGHLPAGSRTKLVDAVLEDPQVCAASHLAASVPTGDTELLDRIRERAGAVDVRAAGATVLVEADLRRDQRDPGLRPSSLDGDKGGPLGGGRGRLEVRLLARFRRTIGMAGRGRT